MLKSKYVELIMWILNYLHLILMQLMNVLLNIIKMLQTTYPKNTILWLSAYSWVSSKRNKIIIFYLKIINFLQTIK
jgi:hypothetical protein